MKNCCKTFGQDDLKHIVSAAKGAYGGYKKGGAIGALIGGLKGYTDSVKNQSPLKKFVVN